MKETSFAQNPLDTDITYLKGVGPIRGKVLKEYGICTVKDLLYHFPRKHLDRTTIKTLNQIKIGETVVVIGEVVHCGFRKTRRRNFYQITLEDGKGRLQCNWFNSISWVSDKFKINQQVAVFGKIDFYKGFSINHPEFDILNDDEDPKNTGRILAQYPSTAELKAAGLESRGFRRLITNALLYAGRALSDHFSPKFLSSEGLMSFAEAIHSIHQPNTPEDLKNAIYRLKFDELFFLQLLMALKRESTSLIKGTAFTESGDYTNNIFHNLNFKLTNAQVKALREIRNDLSKPVQMNRLLQGDVGCGKTIVALLTATLVADNGAQSVIIAPTEILARQHFSSLSKHCEQAGLKIELLLGGQKKEERQRIIENLNSGNIQLIVGTHALIQPDVEFQNLGLVIIDEQHRFGVEQRKALLDKGNNPDVLAMTATPIPRTLAITYHGDMHVTIIDELPGNRQPVRTFVVESDKMDRIYQFLKEQVAIGSQCFIVYPIIEESEKLDLKAAETEYKKLKKQIFPEIDVGFVHGKMKTDERDAQMQQFKLNQLQIMVATTVIEVGIDIPNATVMVVDNAERFGLAQLHQLRGRVGRGEKEGFCVLISRSKEGELSDRLRVMEKTSDGFEIADEDLRIRGPGDFFGTKQHGHMKLKIADIAVDGFIARKARTCAFELVSSDPKLSFPEHEGIKTRFKNDFSHMLEYLKTG